MKTKRKLMPKDVVMGNVGEPKIVGVTGSCVSHVGEGSRPSVPAGSQLECLVGRVVDGRHMGNINDVGLCSAGNLIDDVGCSFHVDEFIGTRGLQTLVASSSANRKRTRDVMSKTTTSNVGSSSSSTRRRLHSGRHSANTSVSNDDSVFLTDTSNVHTNDYSLRGNRTGPPLEYKDVEKCYHSCEHCGARFWSCCTAHIPNISTITAFATGSSLYGEHTGVQPENEVDNRMAHFSGDNSGLCRDIVEAMGLLGDDKEWETTLIEASSTATPPELRTLLALTFTHCQVSNPSALWWRTRNFMSNDIPYVASISLVTKNTLLATLLKETDLIVWDESSMNDRQCFETLDRTLRDILDTPTKLFGGKPIMLGGDFKQTLPKICASPKELYQTQKKEVSTFAEMLLNVGDGTLDDENGVTKLINFICDEHTLLHPTAKDLQDKAIVCPKNAPVDVINTKIMNMLLGHNTTYISNDEAMPYGHDGGEVNSYTQPNT
nr:DNA helicase [Tanacetum cinerariifolium]